MNQSNESSPHKQARLLALASLVTSFLIIPSAYAELKTGMAADVVVGQRNFVSGSDDQGGSAGANTLDDSYGIFSDGTRLFIGDTDNHRVLIYNRIPTGNNAPADVVVGQPDFATTSAGASATKMNQPHQVWFDGTRLFVAEWGNDRVLIFNRIPTTNGAAADVVVGQANFAGGACNQGGSAGPNTLCNAVGVWSDGTKLIIADNENNRILVYNTIPTRNNASADIVIGQPDFTTTSSGCAANKFTQVQGLFSDGKRLVVAEWGNARILIWNSIPTANNVSADVVVDQKDFTSCTANQGGRAAANTLGINNFGPTIYAGRLFVPDSNNRRVLIWNRIPTENNAPADIVIGQTNLLTGTSGTTASKLAAPGSVFSDGKRLYIVDQGNSRVLIYNLGTPAINLSPQFKQGKAVLGKVFWDLNGNGRQDRVLPSLRGRHCLERFLAMTAHLRNKASQEYESSQTPVSMP